ncbi:P-loop containing nucleoside triphosphate hydrolase protein, partial [Gorgonomyces haynaldii]
MSNATYSKYWADANQQLYDQLEYERPKDPSLLSKDPNTAFQHMATLYIKYIQIYRNLEESYNEMLHPQKRRLLREVVTGVIGRILEIRFILVNLSCSDFFNYNDILLDLKLTPDQLNVSIPRFLVQERQQEIDSRKTLLESLNAKDFSFGKVDPFAQELSIIDAVQIIQISERGRQGKLRAKYMRDIRMQAKKEKESLGEEDLKERAAAALKIQTIFRGFRERVKFRSNLNKELCFLGMEAPSSDNSNAEALKKTSQRRKQLQKQYEEEYLQALVSIKEKIHRVEGPDMKEAMQDDFRTWYMEHKRNTGSFPEFPSDEVWQKPGFKFTTFEAELQAQAAQAAEAQKEEKPATPKEKKKDGKKKDEEEEEDPTAKYRFDDSIYLKTIEGEQKEFKEKWESKDEYENFAQKHDPEIIKADKRKEVEIEIKKEVFEILADELKNLKLAVENEKGKKGKGKGKDKKKGKKEKKDKGKKGKKEKDLTANRTMESLVEELVQTGLLQKYTPESLNSFVGEYNLMDTSISKDPFIMPSLGELKKTLVEYCIMPMAVNPEGSKIPKIASLLLYGPSGSGKSLLIRAIASEMGAQIFNLSPRNSAGQFVGKSNVSKMVHMVFKVARNQGPSIIYIDGIEMVFAKKVPKDDTSDPKRIKKDLLKSIKLIKDASEKVILIGTSSKPWDADVKALVGMFDKLLYIPKPDYASRLLLWKTFTAKLSDNKNKSLDFSMLTRSSEGMTAGLIEAICSRVLTQRRVKTV